MLAQGTGSVPQQSVKGTMVLLKQGQNMGPADNLALYHRMNSLPEVQEIMDALMRATTCSRRAWAT